MAQMIGGFDKEWNIILKIRLNFYRYVLLIIISYTYTSVTKRLNASGHIKRIVDI